MILCEGIAPKGDVDGFVEVVDPDDFKGGEQLFIEWEEFGLCIEGFVRWGLEASTKSFGVEVGFFGIPLCDGLEELILEDIILDSILLQALVSIASGLTLESYCKLTKKQEILVNLILINYILFSIEHV